MPQTEQIANRARWLQRASELGLFLLPFGCLVAVLQGAVDIGFLRDAFPETQFPDTLEAWVWASLGAIAGVTVALAMAVLWHLRCLFRDYAEQNILGHSPARRLLSVGRLSLALAIWSVVGNTLVVLALTLGNAPGSRSLSIGIGSDDIALFLTAGLLTTVGWVLTAAADVAAENARFV